MSTQSDPPQKGAARPPRSTGGAKKKQKAKKARRRRPLTEQEVNVPDRQTLWMLGSLTFLGITLWVFAHAGCNYHPPRETRRPRAVTTADLTREPKDAAIEFQQRLLTHNYEGALEIAASKSAGKDWIGRIEQQRKSCEADRAACDRQKQESQGAITMGILLERSPTSAKVRVITHRVPGGPKKYLALVERDSGAWKITAHVPDGPGAMLPEPSL